MLKPNSLRAALTASLVDADGVKILERNPEKLAIFIEQGRIAGRLGGSIGFEWRYKLTAILTDFTGDVDAVALIVMLWLAEHQPELLGNHQAGNEAVKFDADIIDASTIDLQLELELNETVDAKPRAGGGYDVTHRAEQIAWPNFEGVPAGTRLEKFYLSDSLILEAHVPPAP